VTPTHTPVDLTDEQRANLAKLAAAHTPGPWWIERRSELQIQARHRGEGSTYCVATVNHWEVPEANACLIAAAPDLLAALETLSDLAENFSVSGVYFGEACMVAERRALDAAYDAIAKATGYSSALAALNAETNEMVALTNQRHG
jgi:hypothetical protein